jgi:hypothetical protein
VNNKQIMTCEDLGTDKGFRVTFDTTIDGLGRQTTTRVLDTETALAFAEFMSFALQVWKHGEIESEQIVSAAELN